MRPNLKGTWARSQRESTAGHGEREVGEETGRVNSALRGLEKERGREQCDKALRARQEKRHRATQRKPERALWLTLSLSDSGLLSLSDSGLLSLSLSIATQRKPERARETTGEAPPPRAIRASMGRLRTAPRSLPSLTPSALKQGLPPPIHGSRPLWDRGAVLS